MTDDKSRQTWNDFVQKFNELYAEGIAMGRGLPAISRDGETLPMTTGRHSIVICSPHPDDEALSGALPFRLQNPKDRVLNLAVTLGSSPDRKEERKRELAASCRMLGFDCRLSTEPLAFPDTPGDEEKIHILTAHFDREMPSLILFPHVGDGHPTHIAVHHLAMAAAKQHSQKNGGKVLIAETEFWQPLKKPNLVLGMEPDDIAVLLAALVCHRGEISRNPFHAILPARMMLNACRGAELTRFGRKGLNFPFAELYRLSIIENGRQVEIHQDPLIIPSDKKPALAELMSC